MAFRAPVSPHSTGAAATPGTCTMPLRVADSGARLKSWSAAATTGAAVSQSRSIGCYWLIRLLLMVMALTPFILTCVDSYYSSYIVNHSPFTNTSSTIPDADGSYPTYWNQTQLQWYAVNFNETGSNCSSPPIDLPATRSNYFGNNHCVSELIPTNFSYYLFPFARGLQIIPSLGVILFYPDLDDTLGPSYEFDTLLVTLPQPDNRVTDSFRLVPITQSFLFGFNSEKLWNISNANFSYTYIELPAQENATYSRPSSIFILRGSAVSYVNASHPFTQTRLKFELQIFELTEVIVMHIFELSHASADDLWHPLSIGSLWASDVVGLESSMALNNEFVPITSSGLQPYSTTIHFTPFFDDGFDVCVGPRYESPCQGCISTMHYYRSVNCVFCPTTGACWSAPTTANTSAICPVSSTTMPINMTGSTPFFTNQTVCPPQTFYSCQDCVRWGLKWCTGEADCGVVDESNCDPFLPDYHSLDWTSFVPRCLPKDQPCSETTCGDLYSAENVACSFHFNNGGDEQVKCMCATGYLSTDAVVNAIGEITDFGSITKCTNCDTVHGYYESEPGICEKCPSITPGTIAGLCIGAIVITFLLVKLNSHPLVQKLMIPIQNSIVYFQVISLLALIDFHWPLAIRNGFTFFGILGLNFFHLSSVQCWLTADQKLLIAVISPAVIGGLLLICSLLIIIYKRIQRCIRKTELSKMHRVIHKRRELFRRAFISFLLLFYNYLVYTFMGSWFLISFWEAWGDKAPDDDTPINKQRFWLALCGTFFYAAGIPFLFWFLIFPRTEVKYPSWCPSCCRKQPTQTIAVQPLISRYRLGYCQYWEVIFVCLWKLLFNAIVVFISSRQTQIILIAILLVGVIVSYAYFQPYVSGINNREQQWLMSGSLIILFGGVLFYVGSPGDTGGKLAVVVISYLIVIATMSFMMLVIVYVIVTVIQEYRSSLSDSLQDPEYDLEEEFIYSDQPQTRHSINNLRSNSIPTNILPDTVLRSQHSSSLPNQSSLAEMTILSDDPFTSTPTTHPTAISIEDSNSSLQLNPAVVKSDELVLSEFVRPSPPFRTPPPPSSPSAAFNTATPIESSTTAPSETVSSNEVVVTDQQLLDAATIRSEME